MGAVAPARDIQPDILLPFQRLAVAFEGSVVHVGFSTQVNIFDHGVCVRWGKVCSQKVFGALSAPPLVPGKFKVVACEHLS